MSATVAVEFPVEEAEAMLKRLGIAPMTRTEAEVAGRGKERLERAVAIERGSGGAAEETFVYDIPERAA